MKSNAQAWQDLFAYGFTGRQGTYIEIGANHPYHSSNTYQLEVNAGWRGISVEYDIALKPYWDSGERRNRCYFEDAMTFDYAKALQENGLPTHINYLSCDIEPPENTLKALKQVIGQGITFDCITFEHDYYTAGGVVDKQATDFLIQNGYKVAVFNVYPISNPGQYFETWFVKKDLPVEPIDFNYFRVMIYENKIIEY
jgi:hypothetical protein